MFFEPFAGPWKSEATPADTDRREALYGKSPYKTALNHWLANFAQKYRLGTRGLPGSTDQSRYDMMEGLYTRLKFAPPVGIAQIDEVVSAEDALHTQSELCDLIAMWVTNIEETHRMQPCLGPGCRHAAVPSGISNRQTSAACKRALACQDSLRSRKGRRTQKEVFGSPGETSCCGSCTKYHLGNERENDIKKISEEDHISLLAEMQDATDRVREEYRTLGYEEHWAPENHKGHPSPCENLPIEYGQPAFSDGYPSPKNSHVPDCGHTFF